MSLLNMVSSALFLDVHPVVAHWRLMALRWIRRVLASFGLNRRRILSAPPVDWLDGQDFIPGWFGGIVLD